MSHTKTVNIDFFCILDKGARKHSDCSKFLSQASADGGYSVASEIKGSDPKNRYQFRGLVEHHGGSIQGIFGRCRYEKLTQGDDKGSEADVELKPGHGLVEKNHFLFFPGRNLLVYRRNADGSHHSKLEAYLNQAVKGEHRFVLEPIRQRTAYERLLSGGELRRIEISFAAPADPDLYTDMLTPAAAELLRTTGAHKGHIRLSVGRRKQGLLDGLKEALYAISRTGIAPVIRAKVEDVPNAIDLVADRLVESASVIVGADGKVSDHEYFSALENAVSSASAQDALHTFYGD